MTAEENREIGPVDEALFDPQDGPLTWPECTECGHAYDLTKGFRWSDSKVVWVWQPWCKCGKRKRPAPAPTRIAHLAEVRRHE